MKLSPHYHRHQGLDYTSLWIRVPLGVLTQGRVKVSEWGIRLKEGKQNAAHVDHLHCVSFGCRPRGEQQRRSEKTGDCNVHWLGLSGRMSCRVVFQQRRSWKINGGFCQMPQLQLRTSRQQTGCCKTSKGWVMAGWLLCWIPSVSWENDKPSQNFPMNVERTCNMWRQTSAQDVAWMRPLLCSSKNRL